MNPQPPETAQFPVPPPPEIGPVVWAHDDVKDSVQRKSKSIAIMMVVLFLAVGMAAGSVALTIFLFFGQTRRTDRELLWPTTILAYGLTALCVWAVFKVFRKEQTVGYVGQAGVAIYHVGGRKRTIESSKIIRFADVRWLYVSRVDMKVNLSYAWSTCRQRWVGQTEAELFDTYHRNGPAPTATLYALQLAAENAWTQFALGRASQELQETGWVSFPTGGKSGIRVGRGLLEFVVSGQPHRVARDEIARYQLRNGTLQIHHEDARWFSNKGRYDFSYRDIPNAAQFFTLLDRLLGIRPG